MNESHEEILKKLEFYKGKAVHVTVKKKIKSRGEMINKFYNGIVSEIRADSIILKDRQTGETIILFTELEDVEPLKYENPYRSFYKS